MTKFIPTSRKTTDKEANAMASNDVEVLDPAATVEKVTKFASERVLNRRHFIAALGVAGAAAGTELVSSGPTALAQQPKPNGYAQVDVINFLLNIKYLKATLYSYITQGADLPGASGVTIGTGGVYNPPGKITFVPAQINDMFNEMYYDELNQLIALRALQGVAAAGRATVNLLGTGPSGAAPTTTTAVPVLTQSQAIGLARMLEDLSASAFAYATIYLTGTNLAYATQALAVDAAHAGAIRLISIQTGAAYQSTEYLTTFQVGTTASSSTVYAIGTLPATVVAGQAISGTGIPAGAVITAVSAKANAAPTGVIIKSSQVITGVSSVTGIAIGQPITGTNIPVLTYVTGVTSSPNTITISQAVTATPTAVAPTGIVTSGSNVVTLASTITGLTIGQPITGTGIPANTTISATGGTSPNFTITMSAAATASSLASPTGITTAGSNVITSVSSITGLLVGQPITDAQGNIPANTTISSLGTNTITISANATATSSAAEKLTSPITETLSTPAAEALAIAQNALTISLPANASGSTTAIVLLSDSMDVAPGDPGTAALAAAGPAAATSSSPAVYQGFFDTAGSVTASANNPAGMIFARTFQQVLAVLYNYNSSTSTVATQNYEGGFFPFGVSGPINSVT
jgi:hypothetical protein